MQYTENYQYRKPVIGIDIADIKDMNFNSDKTDALIHNTQISLAPAYDLTKTYDTGDVVMYETLMYKCKEDGVAGAWDASKWERTTAGEEGSGGGGTSVVPNPQGEPTDTLRTIGIDGTVFDIAGSGGGGGSAYTETLLYDSGSPTSGAPFNQDVALFDSLSNYDAIVVEWNTSEDRSRESPLEPSGTVFCTVQDLLSNNFCLHFSGYDTRWGEITFTDTSFNFFARGGDLIPQLYKIKGLKFGGGSSVVPNPSGTPTDTLETIEIDGTVYDIAGSGGGSGGITDEVIFTDTAGTIGTRNITLIKSLNNFDAIYFEWFGTSEEQYTSSHMSPVYPIEANDNGNVSVVCYPTYGNRYILLTGDPTSTSVSLESGTWDTVPLSVYKIHGLKFGGGGTGGGLERTLLWDYVTDNNNVIPYGLYTETLHDDIDNYDFIVAEIVSSSGDLSASGWQGTNLWTIDVNALNNAEVQNYLNYTSFGERSSRFYIKDTTFQKTTDNQGNTNGLVRVYGLKCAGSSGGGRTEDVLFEKPYLTANPNTIVLNHAFTDYDEIQFWTVKKDDGGYYDYLPVNIVPVEYLTDAMAGTISGRTNVINISGWQPMSQFLRISVTSASELAVVVNNNNLLIRKITGIKH